MVGDVGAAHRECSIEPTVEHREHRVLRHEQRLRVRVAEVDVDDRPTAFDVLVEPPLVLGDALAQRGLGERVVGGSECLAREGDGRVGATVLGQAPSRDESGVAAAGGPEREFREFGAERGVEGGHRRQRGVHQPVAGDVQTAAHAPHDPTQVVVRRPWPGDGGVRLGQLAQHAHTGERPELGPDQFAVQWVCHVQRVA